jgi:hypothetical protein
VAAAESLLALRRDGGTGILSFAHGEAPSFRCEPPPFGGA